MPYSFHLYAEHVYIALDYSNYYKNKDRPLFFPSIKISINIAYHSNTPIYIRLIDITAENNSFNNR